MTVTVGLAALSVLLFVGAVVVFVCLCVCAARDDRLMEAWREERERNDAAINAQVGGWRNGPS